MVNLLLNSGASLLNGKPIVFLTQWKIVGNSTVHTDEYLTQWKVEGNSVVDNNAILSCGDYSDVDGKYHVKISNGVTIYDIPLDEPLRKVNDIADTIEFADGVGTVIRKCAYVDLGTLNWGGYSNNRFKTDFKLSLRPGPHEVRQILNTGGYTSVAGSSINSSTTQDKLIAYVTLFVAETGNGFIIRDESFSDAQDAKQKLAGIYAVYELATPITEVIQVSPFPISPTDTYTSVNDTPYSAFEYKKNVEIWSCGEYNATDGKYHILVQPLGGGIADISLDEPLRKTNDVADTIEFVNGMATLTRAFGKVDWLNDIFNKVKSPGGRIYFIISNNNIKTQTLNILSSLYITVSSVWADISNPVSFPNLYINSHPSINLLRIVDEDKNDLTAAEFAQANANADVEIIYELATPTTETIQVPQIEEADSYSCVISQGGKAVSWSSFETE